MGTHDVYHPLCRTLSSEMAGIFTKITEVFKANASHFSCLNLRFGELKCSIGEVNLRHFGQEDVRGKKKRRSNASPFILN